MKIVKPIRKKLGQMIQDIRQLISKVTFCFFRYFSLQLTLLSGLRKSIRRLYEKNSDVFGTSINNALQSLSITLAVDMRINSQKDRTEEIITVFVILFEVFAIGAPVLLEQTIPQICTVMNLLNVDAQARIVHIWSKHCKDILKITLETLQQIITLQVICVKYKVL